MRLHEKVFGLVCVAGGFGAATLPACQFFSGTDREAFEETGVGSTVPVSDGDGGGNAEVCDRDIDCGVDADCRTWRCDAGACLDAFASPGVSCDDGSNCSEGNPCLCDGSGVCAPVSCIDGVANQDESDVDCGGELSGCPRCSLGDACFEAADCGSKFCDHSGTDASESVGIGTCAPCSLDADCDSDEFCHAALGVCTPKADLGVPCAGPSGCLSAFCVMDDDDAVVGVCCNAPCGDGCDVCAASNGAIEDGICTILGAPGRGIEGIPGCDSYLCQGTASCPASCDDSQQDCVAGSSCVAGECCVGGVCG